MRGKPGQIKITGDEISGDGDNLNSLELLTAVDFENSQYKTRSLEVRDGITTKIEPEGVWTTGAAPAAGGAHTIASHSDTTATGAELEELTDGSETVLHSHAGGSGTVDTSGTPVANDIARFTDADTIEGRSYAELKGDLNLEIGTDVLAEQTIGIADDNLLEVDDADAASTDYARFTANGLQGRDATEVKTDLGLVIGTDVLAEQTIGIADNNLVEIDHAAVADDDYAKFTANGLEGREYSEVLSDIGAAASGHDHDATYHALTTVGIANDNLVEVDDADAADNDYAKFTANGLEGREYSEVRSDLNVADGADVTADNTCDSPNSIEYMVPVWAEENAGLATAGYEWAFGNGANSQLDDGLVIYVPSGQTCTLVAMSLKLGATPTAITVEAGINGALKGALADVTCTGVRANTNDSFTPVAISDGDYITFRTTSVSGTTAGPNVICAWLKYTG